MRAILRAGPCPGGGDLSVLSKNPRQGSHPLQSRTPALRIAVAVAGLLLLAGLAAPLRAEAQTGEKPAASGTNGAKTSNGAKPSNGTKAGNGANGAKSAPAPAAPPAP
ncbi:MAG: hypothetical protein ABII76_15420, partial [Pseudomonadota bacterium]